MPRKKRVVTLEEQIASVIANRRPVLARRATLSEVEELLAELPGRVRTRTGLSYLLELKPYDFRGTQNLWIEEGSTETGARVFNYDLARMATNALVKKLLEEHPDWTFVDVVKHIDQETFYRHTINRFGTTICGMLRVVYRDSPHEAVIDLVMHDNEYAKFRDLRPWDFEHARVWTLGEKKLNTELARQATDAFLRKLMETNGWDFVGLIKNLDYDLFYTFEFSRYGAKIGGMVSMVYGGSISRAVTDWFNNYDGARGFRESYPRVSGALMPRHVTKAARADLIERSL